MDNLVTLISYANSYEAHLLRTRLEDEEIQAFVFDENIVQAHPFFDLCTGGIKVKVRQSDYEAAKKILQSINDTKLTDDEGNELVCPKCGSHDISGPFKYYHSFKGILSLLSILFMAYPFYADRKYRCNQCKSKF